MAIVHSEIEVCQCCMLTHANGECCGEDHDSYGYPPLNVWENNSAVHLALGGEGLGFGTSECEGCYSPLHGDRYAMTVFYRER